MSRLSISSPDEFLVLKSITVGRSVLFC